MKNIFFILILFFYCINIFSQRITVNGMVVDERSEPIVGCMVSVKSITTVLTDATGKYNIKADIGDTLLFSYLGCQEQKIVVSGEKLDITLKEKESIPESFIFPVSRLSERYKGIVVNKDTSHPVSEVVIVQKSKYLYNDEIHTSNKSGIFDIQVNHGDTLMFSKQGYYSKRIEANSNSMRLIVMQSK
jgi:hypothetical protein